MSNFEKDIYQHKLLVMLVMNKLSAELQKRADGHDASKLKDPERKTFAEYTPKLKQMVYGSEEYKKALEGMGTGLKSHYAQNTHHPEHFVDGVEGMSLVDLMEMVADWIASVSKQKDGNVNKSLEIQKDRFKIDDQLMSILKNTVKLFPQETIEQWRQAFD